MFITLRISVDKRLRTGEDSPLFRGGKTKDCYGYVILSSKKFGEDIGRSEHRVIFESHLGRKLKSHEIIHHKNGVKDDNRIENLELMNRSSHASEHSKKTGTFMACSVCGSERWYGVVLAKSLKLPYLCRECYPLHRWDVKHPLSKLTKDQVDEIRKRRTAGEKGTLLAKEFQVSQAIICDIFKNRKNK